MKYVIYFDLRIETDMTEFFEKQEKKVMRPILKIRNFTGCQVFLYCATLLACDEPIPRAYVSMRLGNTPEYTGEDGEIQCEAGISIYLGKEEGTEELVSDGSEGAKISCSIKHSAGSGYRFSLDAFQERETPTWAGVELVQTETTEIRFDGTVNADHLGTGFVEVSHHWSDVGGTDSYDNRDLKPCTIRVSEVTTDRITADFSCDRTEDNVSSEGTFYACASGTLTFEGCDG
jgi:hypothetical protein